MTNNCLNCNNPIQNNFCSVCGQKTATHRFSLQHFFVHDFLHGVFHFDKGFLYTLKELFTRPGHSIREYIQGKRINHFNYFAFIFIVIAIMHYLGGLSPIKISELKEEKYTEFYKVTKDYYKIVTLAGIPLFALVSYFLFKKSKQNYTEHLVLNIYRLSAYLILTDLFTFISLFFSTSTDVYNLMVALLFSEIIYSSCFFYQYFSVFGYKRGVLTFRSILIAIILVMINNGLIRFIVDQIGRRYFH